MNRYQRFAILLLVSLFILTGCASPTKNKLTNTHWLEINGATNDFQFLDGGHCVSGGETGTWRFTGTNLEISGDTERVYTVKLFEDTKMVLNDGNKDLTFLKVGTFTSSTINEKDLIGEWGTEMYRDGKPEIFNNLQVNSDGTYEAGGDAHPCWWAVMDDVLYCVPRYDVSTKYNSLNGLPTYSFRAEIQFCDGQLLLATGHMIFSESAPRNAGKTFDEKWDLVKVTPESNTVFEKRGA